MYHEGYPTKSGCLTFDPVGFSINIWRPTGVSVSDTRKFPRIQPVLEPIEGPTNFVT